MGLLDTLHKLIATYPFLTLIIGFITLGWSADRFVNASAAAAKNIGVSKIVIGLTAIAVGTSAPEIMVGIQSCLKDLGQIAIGNAIGSNIANMGLVLGITALVSPLPFARSTLKHEMPWLIGATLLTLVCLFNLPRLADCHTLVTSLLDHDIARIGELAELHNEHWKTNTTNDRVTTNLLGPGELSPNRARTPCHKNSNSCCWPFIRWTTWSTRPSAGSAPTPMRCPYSKPCMSRGIGIPSHWFLPGDPTNRRVRHPERNPRRECRRPTAADPSSGESSTKHTSVPWVPFRKVHGWVPEIRPIVL